MEEPRGEESAHWLVELAELRVCVGPNGTDAMIAGQTKLAVFIDGWISEAGPARQPTLVAEPTEPTALAAGPMVGGARGALGLANWLMGPGGAVRGGVPSGATSGVRALACGAGGLRECAGPNGTDDWRLGE